MPPKIITVANTKGGVGKTVVALQLAIGRALQGKDVWLIDGDVQRTALTALSLRSNVTRVPTLAAAAYSEGALLRSQVECQASKWDTIVIDIGGFDSTALRTALLISDAVLVPFQPRSFDVWSLSRMQSFLQEAAKKRSKKLRAFAMLNFAETSPTSGDNAEALALLSEYPEFEWLGASFCRRKAFSSASSLGLGVQEMKVKDKKAIQEVKDLLAAVFEREPKGRNDMERVNGDR